MLSHIVFYCVLLSSVFYSDCVNKYCTPNFCANKRQHTLCKFQTPGPASHCLAYEQLIKSDKDKQLVLDKINARRDKVAAGEIKSLPPAEDMLKMEWDEELAESAQRWADQCVTNKDAEDVEDDCRDLENVRVGQNVATVYGVAPGLTPTALVDVWYLQLLNVNASVLSRYRTSKEVGPSSYNQFTQLVWAASYQVGCGGVKFKEHSEDSEDKNDRVVYRLVCNFAPQGNQLEQSVYTAGHAGAKCVYGTSNTYKTLCNSQAINLHENDNKDLDETESEEVETTTNNINDDDISVINNQTTNLTTESAVLDVYGVDNMTFDYFAHLFELTSEHFPTTTTSEKSKCKNDMAVDEIVEIVKNKLSDDPALKAVFATTVPTSTGSVNIKDEKVAAFLNKIYNKATPLSKPVITSTDFVNSTLLVNLVEAVMFRNTDEIKEKVTQELVTGPFVNPIKVQAVSAIRPSYDFTGHYFFPEYDGEETSQQTNDYDVTSGTSGPDVIMEIEEIRKSRPTRDFLDEILETEPVIETTTRMRALSPDDIKLHTIGYNNMRNFLKDIAEKSESSNDMFTSVQKEADRFKRKQRRNRNIKNHNMYDLEHNLCMITRFDGHPMRERFKTLSSIKHCNEVERIISELQYDKKYIFRNKCVTLIPIGLISLLPVTNSFSLQMYLY